MQLNTLNSLNDAFLFGKTVLVRVDMDIPLNDDMSFGTTFRIDRCIPTIKKLVQANAKVVLLTKIGDPEKQRVSTKILAPYLSTQIGREVLYVNDYMGEVSKEHIEKAFNGDVLLLENVRFYDYEGNFDLNDQKIRSFADLFNIFINEAFAMCHRNELSVTGFAKILPSYAGLNLTKEIEVLDKVLKSPNKPLTFIVGGAKIESKLPVINNFLSLADNVLVGGKLILEEGTQNLKKYINVNIADPNESKLDISDASIEVFSDLISKSNTIIWAGPVGKFEEESSSKGTKAIYRAIVESNSYKVAGGGDTVSAIEKFGNLSKFDFVSTGGGAMLEYLSGKPLEAIKVLYN